MPFGGGCGHGPPRHRYPAKLRASGTDSRHPVKPFGGGCGHSPRLPMLGTPQSFVLRAPTPVIPISLSEAGVGTAHVSKCSEPRKAPCCGHRLPSSRKAFRRRVWARPTLSDHFIIILRHSQPLCEIRCPHSACSGQDAQEKILAPLHT